MLFLLLLFFEQAKKSKKNSTRFDQGNILVTLDDVEYTTLYRGKRNYELSNHLGNVQVVVSDKRISVCDSELEVDYFKADVLSAMDYYPFGMMMPDRQWYADSDSSLFRFGFGGHLKDDEINGVGNSYSSELRQYDSRLGRWFSNDPLFREFPFQSPYVGMDNRPIWIMDPSGGGGDSSSTTQAAVDAVAYIKKTDEPGTMISRCNQGLNHAFTALTGSHELDNKLANDMITHMRSSANWEVIDVSKAQEAANNGDIVIATYKNPKGSGHVAMVVPGKAQMTGTWKGKPAKSYGGLPRVMDTGYKKRTEAQGINYSFGKDIQNNVVFYRYVGPQQRIKRAEETTEDDPKKVFHTANDFTDPESPVVKYNLIVWEHFTPPKGKNEMFVPTNPNGVE